MMQVIGESKLFLDFMDRMKKDSWERENRQALKHCECQREYQRYELSPGTSRKSCVWHISISITNLLLEAGRGERERGRRDENERRPSARKSVGERNESLTIYFYDEFHAWGTSTYNQNIYLHYTISVFFIKFKMVTSSCRISLDVCAAMWSGEMYHPVARLWLFLYCERTEKRAGGSERKKIWSDIVSKISHLFSGLFFSFSSRVCVCLRSMVEDFFLPHFLIVSLRSMPFFLWKKGDIDWLTFPHPHEPPPSPPPSLISLHHKFIVDSSLLNLSCVVIVMWVFFFFPPTAALLLLRKLRRKRHWIEKRERKREKMKNFFHWC